MAYKFCSMCSAKLKQEKGGNLACIKCDFVNYRNPRPTASALVLYKNKLLLTKRGRAPYKGWWELPGGFVERGESADHAVVRELKEETGLKIKLERIIGIYPDIYTYNSDQFYTLNIFYVAKALSGKLKVMDDICDSKWYAKKDLPKNIAFKNGQLAIKDLLKIWN